LALTSVKNGYAPQASVCIISPMQDESLVEFGTAAVALEPLPIRSQWILEGAPIANAKIVSRSSDGTARTLVWDCTAGRFNWHYDIDETIYVLEGSAWIKSGSGGSRLVSAGETVLFRAGSVAEWTVDKYIFRTPVPKYARLAMGCVNAFQRMIGTGRYAP
jgi:uncharacterized cupin superfamily protein